MTFSRRIQVKIASKEGDIVLDPFMGVGSTGIAALKMNRRFIGIEIERDYFEAAKKRLQQSQNTLFDNTPVLPSNPTLCYSENK
ncbi:MAG: Modification methylase DpnIIB [candidate division WS2 bacterium]|nr:Modification methylase DpnIIB [Candidatus Psychracetigena formicireducens]